MNKRTKIILNSAIMLVSLGACLICGLSGKYDSYNIWVAILVGLTAMGVLDIGLAIKQKSNYLFVIGGTLFVIPLTVLLIVIKAFSTFVWGYPIVALMAIIVVILLRAVAKVDNAYVADNKKPGYKSYAERKKEQDGLSK